MSLGNRIKEQRKRAGMSQEKVAELVGVSRQAVTKWEADLSAPSTENLFALAKIFGTTVDLLLDTGEDETCRSSSEQTYYLYKMEEAKKAAALQKKRKQIIRIAAIIAICYLVIFFIGWLITGGSGGRNTVFDWLSHYYPLLIAAAVSILSALLGKYRLSVVTLAACTGGVLLGTLLGRDFTGPKDSMSYYGWAIWGAIFLVSFVAGIIWEVFISRKENPNKKKVWLLSGITLAIVILIAVISISFVPKYSQPAYSVGSYRALIQDFSGESKYLFPKEEHLPGEAKSFTVYLKSRFSVEKIGYAIYLAPQAGIYDDCSITCRLINSHPDSSTEIQSDLEYNDTAIQISGNEVKFELDGCQYYIRFRPSSDELSQNAVSLAKAIIDLE